MTPEDFWQILHAVPEPRPIFYRLYHDDSGRPICYSMEDLPGTYIEIDQATYSRNSKWVRVRQAQLIDYRPWLQATKLVPGSQGTDCHARDIMIIANRGDTQKWSTKTDDQD